MPEPDLAPRPGAGPERQRRLYLSGLAGLRPRIPPEAEGLEARARAAMSRKAFAYVAGGARLERAVRANRAAFDRWGIVPRVLGDVSSRDPSIELVGERLPAPFLLAPIGGLDLVHREAALAVARAAAGGRIPVLFDRGIRSGADAVKALALGAAARVPRAAVAPAEPEPAGSTPPSA